MSDESPILPQGKASISGLIIMLGIATLIPAAFIGGYILSDYLGQDSVSKPVEDVVVEPIEEEPIVQDGKPDNSDPQPVPASERIVVDGIGWYPLEEQVVIEQDVSTDNWLYAILLTDAANEWLGSWSGAGVRPTEIGGGIGIGAQTTRLGIVEEGEFTGYELREQQIIGYGLGEYPLVAFYTLKNLNDTYSLTEIYVLGSQYIPGGFVDDHAESLEVFSEAELIALTEKTLFSWIKTTELGMPSPALAYDDITVENNTFYYFKSGPVRGVNSKNVMDNASLFGLTEDGQKLFSQTDARPDIASYDDADRFFVIKNNGMRFDYELRLPIFSDEQRTEYILTPLITVNNSLVTGQYTKTMAGGCGFGYYMRQVDQEEIPGLYEAGFVTGSPSEKIYLANYSDTSFDIDFENWSRLRVDAPTREDFVNAIPIFYYKDALGRWLRFDSIDIVSPGECGKPVIYLYPEQTTDVSVQLNPQGGFTVTEPAYNEGWNVTAEPSGQLVNKADGLTYPYLFWEGRGGLYSEPEKYWVVAKADVESFLVEKLTAFGFNTQEIADFNEFWLPRMEAAPWYKIGFHGTNVMDQIAPMNVSPAPDSVLRVLMDYSELQEPIAENAPKNIPTFKRNGFTVTEWGGVIR